MSKTEKRQLRSLLDGYTRPTKKILSELASLGLSVSDHGKHIKVARSDGAPGIVILSKTASDYRAGRNAATLLIRLLEAC